MDRPLEKIKRFRNRPRPGVVVTVDMLSTGVDIPALEYIAFLRPVKSRILWTQMLGRGTRKCADINKECFTIFDCFDGSLIEYFKNASDFAIDVEESVETVDTHEIIENIWNNVERDYNVKRLVKRLRRVADTMSAIAREGFSAYVRENEAKIEALSLLLRNPRGWDYEALRSIRTELRRHEFSEESLAKALRRRAEPSGASLPKSSASSTTRSPRKESTCLTSSGNSGACAIPYGMTA